MLLNARSEADIAFLQNYQENLLITETWDLLTSVPNHCSPPSHHRKQPFQSLQYKRKTGKKRRYVPPWLIQNFV
uniref:Uncharacterized protein n=1 Tax=Catagonus wagneri TaxID=51154 RepID=A0A8C3X3N5_9CETA